MNLTAVKGWTPWMGSDGTLGGYLTQYEAPTAFNFITIRGAGHSACDCDSVARDFDFATDHRRPFLISGPSGAAALCFRLRERSYHGQGPGEPPRLGIGMRATERADVSLSLHAAELAHVDRHSSAHRNARRQ